MLITTRDFGVLELDEEQVIEFTSPILGFEHLHRYILLGDDELGAGLIWLQSIEQPETCFILLSPDEIDVEYEPHLPKDMAKLLDVDNNEVAVLVIAVIPQDFRKTTVNLKSPIIINTEKKTAAQVILEEDYPIRMPIFGSKEEEEC